MIVIVIIVTVASTRLDRRMASSSFDVKASNYGQFQLLRSYTQRISCYINEHNFEVTKILSVQTYLTAVLKKKSEQSYTRHILK